MKTASVSFACNTPENGERSGQVTHVDLGGIDQTIYVSGEATFAEVPGALVIAGREFPIAGSMGRWVGNRCWDAAEMELWAIAALLNYLRELEWDCEIAEQSLFDAWDAGQPITAAMLERALDEDARP